jgi:FAD/FMN-containing dehydrogenase
MGDGNIHFNLSQPLGEDREAFLDRTEHIEHVIHDIAVALDGSFSAEHGVGVLKKPELARYKTPVEIDLMRHIKQALDPDGIMNPGKIL